jgi:hypothetical protein
MSAPERDMVMDMGRGLEETDWEKVRSRRGYASFHSYSFTLARIHALTPSFSLSLSFSLSSRLFTPQYSELVTTLVMSAQRLGKTVPVAFGDEITYNNSRKEKKGGDEIVLKFKQDAAAAQTKQGALRCISYVLFLLVSKTQLTHSLD